MKISFGTKEEHKRQKQEEFLALSPVERIYAFLRLSSRIAEFPTAQKNNEPTQNFVVKPKNQAWNLGKTISISSSAYVINMEFEWFWWAAVR